MGFLSEVTFGFYDFGKKAFDPKTFRLVELANMTGTIAWQNGNPRSTPTAWWRARISPRSAGISSR